MDQLGFTFLPQSLIMLILDSVEWTNFTSTKGFDPYASKTDQFILRDDVFLNEIFDTKIEARWNRTDTGLIGRMNLGDKEISIILDEYDVKLIDITLSLIDFGFQVDGSWAITNDQSSSSKIVGAVLNASIKKFNELKPDCILFGVNNKNGSIESRVSLYDRISHLYAKGSSYGNESSWIKTANGQYKILSKVKLTGDEMKKIEEIASAVEVKE